ncbi:ferredoxin [Amycolatopsis sp. RTGN1]|uniref:ferredoxin n=1 Tax=Amycolatopsis ponsaeliensis TaxID=2992142 RepID=UPI00254CF12D|nr:ferredoxin [Amycolatopsis sp. RTGN1]
MNVIVDTRLCSGHARCAASAPEVFELDDNGYALPLEQDVPPDRLDQAREGAFACPERAITVD